MRAFLFPKGSLRILKNKKKDSSMKIDDIEAYAGGLNNWIEESLFDAGYDSEFINSILIVCAEIEANIINYAYSEENTERKKPMEVRVSVLDEGVEVKFVDEGAPFNPLSKEEKPGEILEPGGRGLPIIKQLTDKLSYSRIDGSKNVLSLYFINR